MPGAITVVLETGDVTDRRIQPDVEVLAGFAGDFETEIRGVAADVPFLQPGLGPFSQLVCHLRLQRARGQPRREHLFKFRELEKEMNGFLVDGLGT